MVSSRAAEFSPMSFTPAQTTAIAARGNVLVIAGAGTGKTRTLIERCLQLLREGASLDRLLLVTFTEAAAAEMRARLRTALQEELKTELAKSAPASSPSLPASPPLPAGEGRREGERAASTTASSTSPQTPDARPHPLSPIPHSPLPSPADHLAEHLALLDTAQISTLHSFCLRLVREHFHHLAIDPQLVILDERQTRPLARACLTDLLAEHYAARHPHSPAVQQLLRRAGRGSDEPLRALVWQLHRYTQTLPDPDAWFAAQLAAFRNPAPTQWQTWLAQALAEWRTEWLPALAAAPDVPALKLAAAAMARLDVGASLPRASVLECGGPPPLSDAHGPRQRQRTGALQDLAEPATTPDLTEAHHCALAALLAADATDNWKRKKTELRPPFAKLFDEAAFFHALLAPPQTPDPIPHPPSPLAEDWEWSRHEMAALVQLTQQFTADFSEAKRQLGGVDFSDLEQFALRLLRDETTGVAHQCRAQFTHVCVDEYQDINAAQDAILRAVSGTGADANRFLVGDLKQSIYRFRLANPRIFASYAKAWRVAAPVATTPPSPPRSGVIALSENFRSREAILNFVNPLFRALMRESIGGVAYDKEAELKCGVPEKRQRTGALQDAAAPTGTPRTRASVLDCGGPPPLSETTPAPNPIELHLLTNDATEADDSTDDNNATTDLLDLLAVEREARCVALRLRALHANGHEVCDEKTHAPRPVEWRDMVVLMRSPGSRVESYAQEFHRIGVPLQAPRGGFYQALEVSDLLNLLRLLDNPLQDLPLLAVLRSPLVAMSLEDLVALRTANDERLLWDVLVKGARTPTSAATAGNAGTGERELGIGDREWGIPPTASSTPPQTPDARPYPLSPIPHSPFPKAAAFLTRFTAWRELLRLSSLTQCLERVLAETHYESLLLAEPRGAERVANVRRLLDLARQFDPYQRQGLHRFLQFIAAQEEAELDHAPAPAPTDNAVRLMSIHQSKGLEFPVVVVAGLGTMFNERDLRGDILLDEEFGLCPMVAPPGRERRYASLPHWLAQRRGRRELLGEELRLLYVALTRARDTLLLVGTDTGKEVAEKWRGPATPLDDPTLLKARRPLDWLRRWLPTVTTDEDWRSDASGQNALLSWQLYAADDERLSSVGRDSVEPRALVGRDSVEPQLERSEASAASISGDVTTRPLTPALSPDGGEGEAAALDRLRAKLEWQYPNTPATHEPAKTSVTVLRRRAAEAEEPEATTPFAPRFTVAPRNRSGLTATQVGLAHHAFLQCVELARTATALDLRNEAARLTDTGVLTERELAALDFTALLTFWESSVGQLVRANASRVQREVPFTARFTVDELAAMGLLPGQETGVRRQESGQSSLADGGLPTGEPRSTPSPLLGGGEKVAAGRMRGGATNADARNPSPPPSPLLRGREREQGCELTHAAPNPELRTQNPEPEFVIVQGVADLVVFGPQEIWLLDYKTDHFDETELPKKVREHGPQLSLYALALERIYGKKVTRTWLHFLALGRTELL